MTRCERHPEPNCVTCPKAKREVRFFLGLFALTNFCMGMAFFMFLLCSSSEVHRNHFALQQDAERDHVHKNGTIK